MRLITRMFPSIIFHLYDSAEFLVDASDRIKLYKKAFDQKDALEWKQKVQDGAQIFLVSDIRTPYQLEGKFAQEEASTLADMRLQEDFVKTIQPLAACLRFRPPWPLDNVSRKFKYLKGWIYKGIWSPDRSSETRLVCLPPYEDREYDIVVYDLQMTFHNDVVRIRYKYNNLLIGGSNQYDQKDSSLASLGFDSSAEVHTLLRYARKMQWPLDVNRVNTLRNLITKELGEETVISLGLKVQSNTHIVGTKVKHAEPLKRMFMATAKNPILTGGVSRILDATAHVGTESILLANLFQSQQARVTAIEKDTSTYNLLVENTREFKNIIPINEDSVKYLRNPKQLPTFDIIVLDPPFQDMKKDSKGEMELYMSGVAVTDLVVELFKQQQARVIFVHAPKDYQKLKSLQQLPGNIARVAKTVWDIANDFNVFVLIRSR